MINSNLTPKISRFKAKNADNSVLLRSFLTQKLDIFTQPVRSLSGTKQLTVSLVNNLIKRFISINAFEEAGKLILFMQRHADKFDQLPRALWSLTNKLVRSGQRSKAIKYGQYLHSNYPTSNEAYLAKNLLDQ